MEFQKRRAVSPIIATLLLIAIAVASGIIVYVFTGSLAGSLTKSGGSQVTDQISMDAYSYSTIGSGPTLYLRNTGAGSTTINTVYFNGAVYSTAAGTCISTPTLAVQATCILTLPTASTPPTTAPAGSSNAVKVVTTDGATFTFNVVAGSTG